MLTNTVILAVMLLKIIFIFNSPKSDDSISIVPIQPIFVFYLPFNYVFGFGPVT